jgi:tetratricopeptide (TPR) repeat protein
MNAHINYKDISLYIDGVYDQKKREALEAHLADCPLCRKSLKQAESLKASLSHLPKIEESPGFDPLFKRLLDERIAYQETHNLFSAARHNLSALFDSFIVPVPAGLKIAASLLLIISLSIGIRSHVAGRIPFVEFSSGDVRIYRQSSSARVVSRSHLRLKAGDKIELKDGALINLASRGRYKARIKGDALLVVSRIEGGFGGIDTDFSLSRGSMLVNTTDGFKGSNMRIHTPACDAEIVGTAFAINVSENNTWLGVLEGTVKLVSRPHPLKTGIEYPGHVFVTAGQKAYTRQYACTTRPELLSDREWQSMLELYQLVEDPQIILLVGTGVNRVDGLLNRPAPVYIPDSVKHLIPIQLLRSIYNVVDSVEAGDLAAIGNKTRDLMAMLSQYPDAMYKIEILMFIASHFHYVKDYEAALEVFDQVIDRYPESGMASLARFGQASIYQNDLKDTVMARDIYADLIKSYPDSAEAIRAGEQLSSMR